MHIILDEPLHQRSFIVIEELGFWGVAHMTRSIPSSWFLGFALILMMWIVVRGVAYASNAFVVWSGLAIRVFCSVAFGCSCL